MQSKALARHLWRRQYIFRALLRRPCKAALRPAMLQKYAKKIGNGDGMLLSREKIIFVEARPCDNFNR